MPKFRTFKDVRHLTPARSVFDLSHQKIFDCDLGDLIPICAEEVVPGDKFVLGNEAVIRFQPLVAPILHDVRMYVHYFFVPYRILWNKELGDADDWETFITGGQDGTDSSSIPRWNTIDGVYTESTIYTLWDYLGLPTDTDPAGAYPIDLVRRAYYEIWNEYYRDQDLQTKIDITDQSNYETMIVTGKPR